jgi:hypothetical protein
MHVLICLSYLYSSDALREYVEAAPCSFSEKVSQFVEYYSKIMPVDIAGSSGKDECPDDENFDIDKRTILDLCAHMFHPKNTNHEDSADQFVMSYEVGEFNDMRTDDRIKEFENEQGDLIFECF